MPKKKETAAMAATTDPDAETAMRYNEGKTRYGLIPSHWLRALAEVLTRGANKYGPNNWMKGMDPDFMIDSMERHIQAFRSGQRYDEESGNHHLAHAAWNCLALMTYDLRSMLPSTWTTDEAMTGDTSRY